MQNKKIKGFTLIELLAVIIILAIIALITVPLILNLLETAKIKALEDSVYGVIEAAKLKYYESSLNSTIKIDGDTNDLVVSGESTKTGYWYLADGTDPNNIGIIVTNVSFASMPKYVCTNENTENHKVECKKGRPVNNNTEEITWDGWITLKLSYPINSTDRKYRVSSSQTVREEDWIDYPGSITVPLKDVENVYIKYKLDGKTIIIPPNEGVYVDIEPSSYVIDDKITFKINASEGADVYYKLGNELGTEWLTYENEVEVTTSGVIEAKSIKYKDVYDSNGNFLYKEKQTAYDSVYIRPKTEKLPEEPVDRKPSYYIPGPIIEVSPTEESTYVLVKLRTEGTTKKMYIKIGNSYEEYTDSVMVTKNQMVYAYYITGDGEYSDISSKYIDNIYHEGYNSTGKCNLPRLSIDHSPYSRSTSATISISSNSDEVYYSLNGVEYKKYENSFEIKENQRVYAKAVNSCGTEIDYTDVTNIGSYVNGKWTSNPPGVKTDLSVKINANPSSYSKKITDKVTVTIDYDSEADKKYYEINGILYEYKGEFIVEENTTIYAYALNEYGYGKDVKIIDNIGNTTSEGTKPKGLSSPIIKIFPSDKVASSVKVSIEFDKNANIKQYKIGNGSVTNYTSSFTIYENTTIYAYASDSEIMKTSSYKIDNIRFLDKPADKGSITIVEEEDYFIIKLNYPTDSTDRLYKYGKYSNWKSYKEEGIALLKSTYSGSRDKIVLNGQDFTNDHYLVTGNINEILEQIYMKWSTPPIAPPKIYLSSSEPAKELTVTFDMDVNSVFTEYMILQDGNTTDRIKYSDPFIIKDNMTIYARSIDEDGVNSLVSTLTVTNIDKYSPKLTLTADMSKKYYRLPVVVSATDDTKVNIISYDKGIRDKDYFIVGGQYVNNNQIIYIEENGDYTFYTEDMVGNTDIISLNVTNIDKEKPTILITDTSVKFSDSTTIHIDFGKSVTKEYKLGNSSYQTYNGDITINSYDILAKKLNEGSTVKVCAKGVDEAGNTTEVCEDIYSLDFDLPEDPVIHISAGYPILTEHGMDSNSSTTIDFKDAKLTDNYYSLDGTNWLPYEGEINTLASTIYVKRVKKNSGLSKIVTKTAVIPSDALAPEAYDNDPSTSVHLYQTTKRFNVSPEMQGKSMLMTLYKHAEGGFNGQLYFYNNQNELIHTITFSSKTTWTKQIVDIPVGTAYITNRTASFDNRFHDYIYEISANNAPKITTLDIGYPLLTETSLQKAKTKIKIDYFLTSTYKYYRINSGPWLEYKSVINVSDGDIVEAKGVDKNGVDSDISTFTASLPSDALASAAYDGNRSTSVYLYKTTKRFNVSPEMQGKNMYVTLYKVAYGGQNGQIYFYNAEGKLIQTRTFTSKTSWTNQAVLIPVGTAYIIDRPAHFDNRFYDYIYEIAPQPVP